MLAKRGDVPLHRDATSRFLPWLVAVMVYLAALAMVSAMAMHKVATRWDSGLAGRLTVQVPPGDLTEAAAAQRLEDLMTALRETPGVAAVEALSPEEITALLEPWLGGDGETLDLPMPRLIAVTLDSENPPALTDLTLRVRGLVPDALVDDHQRWLSNLLDLARSIELVSLLVMILVGLSAVTMVIFVTRMGMAIHGHVIELLHLIGAQDAYVARQFQFHALKLGLAGGVLGLGMASLTILLVGYLIGRIEGAILPDFSLSILEWSFLGLLPILAGLVSMMTARVTVLRSLTRMP